MWADGSSANHGALEAHGTYTPFIWLTTSCGVMAGDARTDRWTWSGMISIASILTFSSFAFCSKSSRNSDSNVSR